MELTRKQRAFVEAFPLDPQPTRAAIAAGYAAKSAAVEANRLLKHEAVSAEIARRRAGGAAPVLAITRDPLEFPRELSALGRIREVAHGRQTVVQLNPALLNAESP